ncbi:unnamed protein product [Hyaloperonospora brassicae]|uniref:RxLR effector candidate protein n=1 Tax=Hyaloperonospora brassicae TaxID=162125 RepID=A0AAV0UUL1_HYABA|nr:unnamed protein product [Hyaloperonospora brassicae]
MRPSLLVSAAVLCLATYDSAVAAASTSNNLLKSGETSSVLADHDAVAADTDPKHQRLLRHLEAEDPEIPASEPAVMASNVPDAHPKKVVPFGLQPVKLHSGPPSGTEITRPNPVAPSGKQTVTTNPTAPVGTQTANPNPVVDNADDVDSSDSSDSSLSYESSRNRSGPYEKVAARIGRMVYGNTYEEWMDDGTVTRTEAKAKLYDQGLTAEIFDPMEVAKEMGYIAFLDKKCALPENSGKPACL